MPLPSCLVAPASGPRPERRHCRVAWGGRLSRLQRGLSRLPASPLLTTLPGAARRRRLLTATLVAALVFLLRPWPPFQWLPGWSVGLLLLWALAELVAWLWWPQRSA